jgi:hypothetical protein
MSKATSSQKNIDREKKKQKYIGNEAIERCFLSKYSIGYN